MTAYDFCNNILPLRDTLYRLALRITGDREEAADAVQDTMLKMWSQRDAWSTIDSIPAYCMTMCRNIALDHVKSAQYKKTQALTSDNHPAREPLATQLLEASDTRVAIEQAIASLSDIQRNILALRENEEMSYEEIANALGISMSQVKVYLMRARNKIRVSLAKNI